MKNGEAEHIVYAVKAKDERDFSQSGGAFAVIAKHVISQGGVVYGAAYDGKSSVVKYDRVDKIERLHILLGSKYVQADISDVMRKIMVDLKNDKTVLVCGNPCFIDGVRNIAKFINQLNNLILVDFICHGTSSPLVFNDYYRSLSRRFDPIYDFKFRDKLITGWHGHRESFISHNKKYSSKNYTNIYYSHLAFRQCCYHCNYTNLNRPGDITIGDFWGIDKTNPDFDDNKGCSIVILNSSIGRETWENSKDDFIYISEKIEHGMQPTLIHPVEIPKERTEFWKSYNENGFEFTMAKYCNYSRYDYLTNNMYKFINTVINEKFRKFLRSLTVRKEVELKGEERITHE